MEVSRSRSNTSVIVAKTRNGEAMTEFKSAAGRTVRVLDTDVYRKASASAGRKLAEITGKPASK